MSRFITIVAVIVLLSPVSQQTAHADPIYRSVNGNYYYGGGYAPGYGGYSGYGYNPYGYGSGAYFAPQGYVSPGYQSNGFAGAVGNGVSYNGIIDHGYGGSRFYGQPVRPAYTPYGFGGYSPYGY